MPQPLTTTVVIKEYTALLLQASLENLGLKMASEGADRFVSIPKVLDMKELDSIEAFYKNKLGNMHTLVSIYNEKLRYPNDAEKEIVEEFLAKVNNQDPEFKFREPIKTIDEMEKAFSERIRARRLELEKAKEKPVLNVKAEQMVFKYKSDRLNEDVRKRLEKISKKSKMVLGPIDIQDWNIHLEKTAKKIKNLSSLHTENQLSFEQYKKKYAKPKLKEGGDIKYTSLQRLENYEVKARLYKDMKFLKDPRNNSYSINEIDPITNDCKLEVVAVYDKPTKSVEIMANKMDNEDHYILTMVEQAREIFKQFIEQGKDPANLAIEIDCAHIPETAIKLKKALKILGLQGKYDEATTESVRKYKDDLRGFPG